MRHVDLSVMEVTPFQKPGDLSLNDGGLGSADQIIRVGGGCTSRSFDLVADGRDDVSNLQVDGMREPGV